MTDPMQQARALVGKWRERATALRADVRDVRKRDNVDRASLAWAAQLDECADELTAALQSRPVVDEAQADEWISFADAWPPESAALDDPSVTTTDSVLVTNNIKARDRMGRKSHVWLLSPIKSRDGEVVGFTDGDRKVHSLTHWMPIAALRAPEQPS